MSQEVKAKSLDDWIGALYDVSDITANELELWYESYQYQGFNRKQVLDALMKLVPDKKEATQIIIVCALRGPRRAAETKLVSGRTIASYGIPASGAKGTKGVSCQRIMAATADLAAYYLKVLNVPKRLAVDCPGWLQFPSAGSIKLPDFLRPMHIEFSRKFSTVIGGVFNEQIYQTMMNNAYLKDSLNLFSDLIATEHVPVYSIASSSSASSSAPINPPPAPSGANTGRPQKPSIQTTRQ